MDTITATITEVSRHFSDYINKALYRGENFILTRGGKAVAKLSPMPTVKSVKELISSIDELPKLSNRELDDFSKDLAHLRNAAGTEVDDPWEL